MKSKSFTFIVYVKILKENLIDISELYQFGVKKKFISQKVCMFLVKNPQILSKKDYILAATNMVDT